MNASDIIKALRCSASIVPNRNCEKCAYFYRDEPSPEIAEQYGSVPDDFWDSCDFGRIALAAADMIEQLLKEAGNVGTTDI